MSLAEFNLVPVEDSAKRATDMLQALPPAERELATKIAEILVGHMFAGGDRERIRQGLRALAFCSGSLVAATGKDAASALHAFNLAVSTTVTKALPR